MLFRNVSTIAHKVSSFAHSSQRICLSTARLGNMMYCVGMLVLLKMQLLFVNAPLIHAVCRDYEAK